MLCCLNYFKTPIPRLSWRREFSSFEVFFEAREEKPRWLHKVSGDVPCLPPGENEGAFLLPATIAAACRKYAIISARPARPWVFWEGDVSGPVAAPGAKLALVCPAVRSEDVGAAPQGFFPAAAGSPCSVFVFYVLSFLYCGFSFLKNINIPL